MKTLYSRIVLTTIAIMVISSLIAFVLSNLYYQYNLKPYNDQKVTTMAKDIGDFYDRHPELNIHDYLQHIGQLGYQFYLVNDHGKEWLYGGIFRERDLSPETVQQVLNGTVYHGIAEFPSELFITGFFDNVLSNSIGIPLQVDGSPHALFIRPDITVQFGEMRIFFSIIMAIAILLSILLVGVITRYIVKPIVKLTEATQNVAKGNYNVQLNIARRDELGQLADHFSQMAKGIAQLEQMRQEFVSNVSHEIQSPLASIQGFSQTLQTKRLSEEQQQHYLSIIEAESRRMSQLSKQLLMLASLDKEENILEKSTFDVAEQIKQVLFHTEWSWRSKELTMDMSLPSTYIHGDQQLLHQVWTNLMTNSIKFTAPEGIISLRITGQDNPSCSIEISDTGIGIPPEHLPHIFDRFYRVDEARDRSEGSSGLGLAITQKIVQMHGGRIEVTSQPGEGTTFTVTLPTL
ncbi:sensor histidine kinase [Paenibacillus glucanolyticus]|jgi:signal transduction histidine kinase|uniref:sensor histidine kinase n=1 Tax=Paenibacillus TaxID=44249 RepID=UPI0003E207AF|nr:MULTISPECIES: HAMP domain-containing sensor histidine kinase [Paenibacillus]ANA80128.1 two-component sensor histidine kinase [Paenibacillus glucanolyticus]AVV55846.1 sensor histidine kinase [Paenibacillus glucanolyticus]ETT38537.1 integral membrane sensor signal transduction histidine kinase [Paenibacillus sp. FSL R5-808]